MKIKTLLIAFAASLFVLALTSCNRIDAQLTAFEKSIEKLENNYKDLSPRALEKAVASLQTRFEKLEDLVDEDMTINQKSRFRDLKIQYYKLLLKIKWHTALSDVYESSEGQSVVDYILELLNSEAATSLGLPLDE